MKGFFHQLRNFGNGIEDDLREIKLAKQVPARSCPQTIYADSLLQDARDRARAAKEKVTFMVATCCGTSLEALVAASESLLDEQEERMNEVESVLESEGGGYARWVPPRPSIEASIVEAEENDAESMSHQKVHFKRYSGEPAVIANPPTFATPMKFNRYDDPKTPTLDDFGIASSSHTMSGAFLHNKENTAPASKTATRLDGLFDQTAVSKVSVEISRLGCEASSATQTQSPVSSSTVTSRRRDRGTHSHIEEESENMFPLIKPVTAEELETVPSYTRSHFSLERLNNIVNKINDHVTDMRFDPEYEGVDYLTQEMFSLPKLGMGPDFKEGILLLQNLNRMKPKKSKNSFVYYIVQS